MYACMCLRVTYQICHQRQGHGDAPPLCGCRMYLPRICTYPVETIIDKGTITCTSTDDVDDKRSKQYRFVCLQL